MFKQLKSPLSPVLRPNHPEEGRADITSLLSLFSSQHMSRKGRDPANTTINVAGKSPLNAGMEATDLISYSDILPTFSPVLQ
jgi:hypothetical protein